MYKMNDVKLLSDIRKRMHKCVDIALAPLLPYEVKQPEEKMLFHPVVSIKHVHHILDYFWNDAEYGYYYEFLALKEMHSRYESMPKKEYYINIPDTPGLHPAYLLATLITLMWAPYKKIWLECFLSRQDGEELYMGNPVTGRLIKRFVKEFSELELVSFEGDYDQKKGIEFINEHSEITDVIELGDGLSALWKKKYYKNKVHISCPSTRLVWIQYAAPGKMFEYEILKQFAKYCFEECYNYRCGYDKRMEDAGCEPGEIGLTAHSYESLEQFADNWKDAAGMGIPIIVFHHKEFNKKWIAEKLEGTEFYACSGSDYDPNKCYFAYSSLWYC